MFIWGGLAVVNFYVSVQPWLRTEKGRKIVVREGSVDGEGIDVVRIK